MTSVFHKILRAVAGAMEIPDVVFLVLALGFAAVERYPIGVSVITNTGPKAFALIYYGAPRG